MRTVTALAWPPAKTELERSAIALRDADASLKLPDAVRLALQQNADLWVSYKLAIAAGEPHEFSRAKRQPDTPRERAWQVIETLARALVKCSVRPKTLRDAVIEVVQQRPELYEQYRTAPKRLPRRRRTT